MSPLSASTNFPAMARGLRSGAAAAGIDLGSVATRIHDGWSYEGWEDPRDLETPPPGPEAQARMGKALAELPAAWETRYLPEVQGIQARIRALVPTGASAEAAAEDLAALRDLLERTYEIHFEALMPLNGGFVGLAMMLEGAEIPRPWDTAAGLLASAGGNARWPEGDLRRLGALVDGVEPFASLLEDQDGPGLVAALQEDAGEAGDRFRALWPRLSELATELDVFGPTWGEDPSALVRALAGGRDALKRAEAGEQRGLETQDRAEAAVRERLPPPLQGAFSGLLSSLRAAWFLTETHNVHIDQLGTGVTRLALLRAGERLVRRGLLTSPQEVAFLTLDEVASALRDGTLPKDLVHDRRAERAAALDREPPRFLGTPTEAFFRNPNIALVYGLRPDGAFQAAPDALQGIAASPGSYRGRARVVEDEATLEDLEPGEVLVSTTSQPSWTVVMTRAGAIVAETGGMLCHAAMVAREFGLPGVVAVAGATRRIRTGDQVEVDGDAGTVTIIG